MAAYTLIPKSEKITDLDTDALEQYTPVAE